MVDEIVVEEASLPVPAASTEEQAIVPLDAQEQQELDECETIIREHLIDFVRVGLALMKIRDGKLYRTKAATFEEYCKRVFGISRSTAYLKMNEYRTFQNVHNCGQEIPHLAEAHYRMLSEIGPQAQIQIIKVAAQEIEAQEDADPPHPTRDYGRIIRREIKRLNYPPLPKTAVQPVQQVRYEWISSQSNDCPWPGIVHLWEPCDSDNQLRNEVMGFPGSLEELPEGQIGRILVSPNLDLFSGDILEEQLKTIRSAINKAPRGWIFLLWSQHTDNLVRERRSEKVKFGVQLTKWGQVTDFDRLNQHDRERISFVWYNPVYACYYPSPHWEDIDLVLVGHHLHDEYEKEYKHYLVLIKQALGVLIKTDVTTLCPPALLQKAFFPVAWPEELRGLRSSVQPDHDRYRRKRRK